MNALTFPTLAALIASVCLAPAGALRFTGGPVAAFPPRQPSQAKRRRLERRRGSRRLKLARKGGRR